MAWHEYLEAFAAAVAEYSALVAPGIDVAAGLTLQDTEASRQTTADVTRDLLDAGLRARTSLRSQCEAHEVFLDAVFETDAAMQALRDGQEAANQGDAVAVRDAKRLFSKHMDQAAAFMRELDEAVNEELQYQTEMMR